MHGVSRSNRGSLAEAKDTIEKLRGSSTAAGWAAAGRGERESWPSRSEIGVRERGGSRAHWSVRETLSVEESNADLLRMIHDLQVLPPAGCRGKIDAARADGTPKISNCGLLLCSVHFFSSIPSTTFVRNNAISVRIELASSLNAFKRGWSNRKVDIRLHGKGDSNSHGARLVY